MELTGLEAKKSKIRVLICGGASCSSLCWRMMEQTCWTPLWSYKVTDCQRAYLHDFIDSLKTHLKIPSARELGG